MLYFYQSAGDHSCLEVDFYSLTEEGRSAPEVQVAAAAALFKVGESHEVFFTKSKKKRPWPRRRRRRRHRGAETEAAKVCGILRF